MVMRRSGAIALAGMVWAASAVAGDFAAHGYRAAGEGDAVMATPDASARVIVPKGWVWRADPGGGPRIQILPDNASDRALEAGVSFERDMPSCSVGVASLPQGWDGMTPAERNTLMRDIMRDAEADVAASGDARRQAFSRFEVLPVGEAEGFYTRQVRLDADAVVSIGVQVLTIQQSIGVGCMLVGPPDEPPFEQHAALPAMEALTRSLIVQTPAR